MFDLCYRRTAGAEEAAIPLITVNPVNTSQVCSGSGRMFPEDLAVLIHICPDYALVLDREVNAARNILALAVNDPLGRSGQPVTWPVGASVG